MTSAGPPHDHATAAADGRYDVVVAGAGPAGSAAAIALARAGRTVLLVDAGRGPAPVGEALPAAARVLLRDLGADHALTRGHLPCYANRSAWGTDVLASLDSIRDPHGHGWHLDRPLFDRQLREHARAQGVRVAARTVARPTGRAGAGHRSGSTGSGHWTVELRGPARTATVRCRWIVDATGRAAAVATACGARRLVRDRLVAVHLTLDPAESADTTTTVEAAPEGWWYTAPLPAGRRLLARFTDADLPGARHPGFAAALAATRHIGRLAARHPPAAGTALRRAPAHTVRLDTATGDGWTAVGDAAAAFDPLSSQGILTALFTGLSGGRAVHAHLAGDAGALDGYARTLAAVDTAYRRNHRTHYGTEQRWPDQPFWHRRHTTTPEETPV
ncbi:tryptophan 7-halogenase [Kitasatospora sp. NPDC058965]|uniref:tryptophan 7-halogenase n=1 Tax=Kitasatospora sp. NPDC058965 TaxID=3346682 RepID=UPI0036BC498C